MSTILLVVSRKDVIRAIALLVHPMERLGKKKKKKGKGGRKGADNSALNAETEVVADAVPIRSSPIPHRSKKKICERSWCRSTATEKNLHRHGALNVTTGDSRVGEKKRKGR